MGRPVLQTRSPARHHRPGPDHLVSQATEVITFQGIRGCPIHARLLRMSGKQKHAATSIAPANPRQTFAPVDPAPTAPEPWEKYPAANHPDAAENSSHPHLQK